MADKIRYTVMLIDGTMYVAHSDEELIRYLALHWRDIDTVRRIYQYTYGISADVCSNNTEEEQK